MLLIGHSIGSFKHHNVFHFPLLQKAYRQRYKKTFTDDASVLESLGTSIHLLEGEITNIKITTPEDMLIANTFWETQTSTQ